LYSNAPFVSSLVVFFPVPTLEEVKALVTSHICVLKIKCHSSTELCLVLVEGLIHLTLL